MAILPRKLLFQATWNFSGSSSSCTCVWHLWSDGILTCTLNCAVSFSSPPPPPPEQASLETHIMPYLITMVCALGIAFLLITTCTILLRNRRATTRRNTMRVMAMAASSREDFLDEDRGGGSIDYPIWHIVTVGLSQSVIDSITEFKYKRRDGLIEGNDCSVCLTVFEDGDDLRLLPKCSHAFHVYCIDTWLRRHKSCPLCRAPIVTETAAAAPHPPPAASVPVGNSGSPNSGSPARQGQKSEQQIRDRVDAEIGSADILDGTAMADILKKNRELRAVLSDLGERRRGFGEHVHVLRRSVSLDPRAASEISGAVALAAGSSVAIADEKTNAEREGDKASGDEDAGSGGRLKGNACDGCSLHKSLKLFSSFRRSKSQV